jgi:chaperonin GroES
VSEITLEEIQKHLNPTHDRVIIEREKDPKKTKGGLHLPDSVEMEMEMTNLRPGRVVAVGQGRWNPESGKLCPMVLKVGDRVLFHKNAGERVFVWGRVFQIMGDGDCGLKIQDDTPVEMVYAQMVANG